MIEMNDLGVVVGERSPHGAATKGPGSALRSHPPRHTTSHGPRPTLRFLTLTTPAQRVLGEWGIHVGHSEGNKVS